VFHVGSAISKLSALQTTCGHLQV